MCTSTLCLSHEDRNGASLNTKRGTLGKGTEPLSKCQQPRTNGTRRIPPDAARGSMQQDSFHDFARSLVAITTEGLGRPVQSSNSNKQTNGIREIFLKEPKAVRVTFTRLIRSSAYRIPSSQALSVVDWVKESVQSTVLEAKPIKPGHVVFFPCPFSISVLLCCARDRGKYSINFSHRGFMSPHLSMKRFQGCLPELLL